MLNIIAEAVGAKHSPKPKRLLLVIALHRQSTGISINTASRLTAEKRLKMIYERVLVTNMVGKTIYYYADISVIKKLIIGTIE